MTMLSIIIPVYNVEQYLSDCLNSILQLSLTDIEIICVNDGSTDSSPNIIKKYQKDHNKIILISQPNRGLSAARNAGLKEASGGYVFFLDSDDYLLNNTALTDVLKHTKAQNADICVFNAMVNGSAKYLEPFPSTQEAMEGHQLMRLFYSTCNTLMIPIWGHLYRRQFLLDNHLFFEEGRLHEDISFTPIAQYLATNAVCVNIPVVNYRFQRRGSITGAPSIKNYEDRVFAAKTLYDWFNKNNANEDEPYRYIFSVYDELILDLVKTKLKVSDFLRGDDFSIMNQCCRTVYECRLNKLAKISPQLMQLYQDRRLPTLFHRLINLILQ